MDFFSGLLIAGIIGHSIWEAVKESPEEKRIREREEILQRKKLAAEEKRIRKQWEAEEAERKERQREIDELWRHARALARGNFPKSVGGNKLSDIYMLTWDHVIKYAPNRRGIYYIIEKKGETLRIFYVGQSKSIETRLLRHLKNAGDWGGLRPRYTYVGTTSGQTSKSAKKKPNPSIRKHIRENKCYFMFVRINKLTKRDRIEREQIAKYKPECNRNRGIIKRKWGG
ncbi:MAG: GIY-YIG nuclease family protein [Planctomycetota bacterium]